jgi:TRAP transporter TAXI family solute receptor
MFRRFGYLLCGLLGVVGALCLFNAQPLKAQDPPLEINIVTGSEFGEYHAIARDMETLAAQNDLDIDIIPSRGAVENIHDVYYYSTVPLGIVQSDVLEFLNLFGNSSDEVRRQVEAVRVVYPLYQEKIHVIARKEIGALAELTGKRISIGAFGSGTNMTATLILRDLDIRPAEARMLETRSGIAALKTGEIDALFYVIGVPAVALQEEISPDDNLHLLPITLDMDEADGFYRNLYLPVTLPAKVYDWQTEPVDTIGIQSYLFTAASQDCEQVTPVARLLKENLDWFKENGEAIWADVDLNRSMIPEDRRSTCPGL